MPQPRLAALALLGLTTITAAGFALQQYRRAQDLAAQLAAAREAPARAPTVGPREVEAVEAESATVDVSAAGATDEATVADPTDAAPEAPPPRERNGRMDFAARMEALMQNPEFAAAFRAQQRAALDGRYADLFKRLGLPASQLTQLKDLLAERQTAFRDVMGAARAEGLNGRENRDELRQLVELTQAEIDADIRAAIGEPAFQALQDYERTTPQRNLVEQLDRRLSYSSTPLNSTQSESLVAILAQSGSTGNATGDTRLVAAATGAAGAFVAGRGVTITDEALTRAQSVLTPEQWQALSDLQAEQRAAQTVNTAMREQFRNNRTQNTAATTGPGGGG